jgi:hypothetical protein
MFGIITLDVPVTLADRDSRCFHTVRRSAHEILEIRILPEPRSGFMPLWGGEPIAHIHNPKIRLFFTY